MALSLDHVILTYMYIYIYIIYIYIYIIYILYMSKIMKPRNRKNIYTYVFACMGFLSFDHNNIPSLFEPYIHKRYHALI